MAHLYDQTVLKQIQSCFVNCVYVIKQIKRKKKENTLPKLPPKHARISHYHAPSVSQQLVIYADSLQNIYLQQAFYTFPFIDFYIKF